MLFVFGQLKPTNTCCPQHPGTQIYTQKPSSASDEALHFQVFTLYVFTVQILKKKVDRIRG